MVVAASVYFIDFFRYKQCLLEVWSGFDDGTGPSGSSTSGSGANSSRDRGLSKEDLVHGSLLVLNELLRCSNTEWERLCKQLHHLTHYKAPPPKKVSTVSKGLMNELVGVWSLLNTSHI